MSVTYYRSDQASIGVQIEGVNLDHESWDILEGGENTVEVVDVLPGGMAPQIPLGGIPKRSPATVKRLWSSALITLYREIDEVAGNAAVTVTYEVLGTNKKAAYPALSYTGILGTVMRPNYDATKSEPAYMEITVALSGSIAGL